MKYAKYIFNILNNTRHIGRKWKWMTKNWAGGVSLRSNFRKKMFLVLTLGKFLEALGSCIWIISLFCHSFSFSNNVKVLQQQCFEPCYGTCSAYFYQRAYSLWFFFSLRGHPYNSENLQYNTLGCWFTGTKDSSTMRPVFQVLLSFEFWSLSLSSQ